MTGNNSSTRSVYIWGPQLELVSSMYECGPCELYELASVSETFAFAPQIAATRASAEGWARIAGCSDSEVQATDIPTNLHADAAAAKWDSIAYSSDATASGRVDAIRNALSCGDEFLRRASSGMAVAFESFHAKGVDVLPPPELSLPVLMGLNRLTVAKSLLRSLETQMSSRQQKIQPLIRSRFIPIPPLVGLLLDQCKTPDDIVPQLRNLRLRFAPARAELFKYEAALSEASSLGEQLEAIHDIEQVQERIAKVVAREERWSTTKTVVRHTWDIAKQGSLLKSATKVIDLALEPLLNHSSRHLAAHFVDIDRQLRDIPGYFKLIERVFGERRANHAAFEKFAPIQLSLSRLHSPAST
jgi:hypothetical protein